jgi:excisionase family DNA binding protein
MSAASAMNRETYLPDADEGQVSQLAQVYDFLTAHEQAGNERPAPRYLLAGATPGDQVELPAEVYRLLRQVIEAMNANLAVTVVPRAQSLTTQQVADLLGLSRPTVIKLLDQGQIAYERVGKHRRLLLRDVLAYRESRRAEQYAALEAMAGADESDDVETVLSDLKDARLAVARRRREQPDT